jgi:hypothetical protein
MASWSSSLGKDASPLRTRSALKKVLESGKVMNLHGSNTIEQGALRDIKSLARDK